MRDFVATRKGIPSFQRQLYAEALQRGFCAAETVLILADGAIWIWNLAEDRFKGAKQRVDLHHVQEHLWTLAGDEAFLALATLHRNSRWNRLFPHDTR